MNEKKLFIETYGCQMNMADSEVVASIMKMADYSICENIEEADAIFVNTCSIRDNAEQRVISRLQYFNSLRRKNRRLIVGVLGCMAERVRETLLNEHHADLVVGPDAYLDLPHLVASVENGEKAINVELSATETYKQVLPTRIGGNRISGFISIMRGCNNFCSYCIVPYVRGRERSRTPEAVIAEVKELVARGCSEIALLGQNVNSYGKDLDTDVDFADLIRMVNDIEGVERIRFMTSHPKDLSDKLIDAIAECDKVCKQLHLPVQAGSNKILKEMNRKYTKEHYLTLVDKIRTAVPDIAITTDIIVGFPGETEEDFQETLDVVRKAKYDSAFTFIYSKRSGTPAAKMPDQVSEEVVHERFDRLLKVVNETAREQNGKLAGNTELVLVEEIDEKDASMVTGRLSNNSVVHFKGDASLIGKIVPVVLEESKGFYYLGRLSIHG